MDGCQQQALKHLLNDRLSQNTARDNCPALAGAGDPRNRELLLKIGPDRMAAMLRQLGVRGAVQVICAEQGVQDHRGARK